MNNHDETGANLEGRLRALYQGRFGAPPASATTWQQVQARLPMVAPMKAASSFTMTDTPGRA